MKTTKKQSQAMARKIDNIYDLCDAMNNGFANYGDDFDFELVSKVIKKIGAVDLIGDGDSRYCLVYGTTRDRDTLVEVIYEEDGFFRLGSFTVDEYTERLEDD